jgi:hypothetical protein
MSLQSWEEHRENHEALLREIEERECQAAPSSQTFWDRLIEWLAARARFCPEAALGRDERCFIVRCTAGLVAASLIFAAAVALICQCLEAR